MRIRCRGRSLAVFLLLSAFAAAAEEWRPVGLSGGGAMFAPAISPLDSKKMMINCDMSAAYLSSDGGLNWKMIHHLQLTGNTCCRPAFHPKDPGTIFAASGWNGKLKVSRDGGTTWNDTGEGLPGGLRGEIAIDPGAPKLMLVGAGEDVWLSSDAGASWTKCAGPSGEAVGFHFDRGSPDGRRVMFAATKKGVWRSKDGGTTWSEKTKGLPWLDLHHFSGGSNEKECVLYCSVPSRAQGGRFAGGVYSSSDRGETWVSAMGEGMNTDTKPADQWSMGPIAQYLWVLTTNGKPRTVYALNTNTGVKPPHHASVYRSDDAGKTWKATFTPDPRFGGMNVGYNWQVANINQHYQERPFGAAVCPTNPDWVIHCGSGLCYVTDDGGRSWRPGHTRLAPGAPEKGEESRWLCNGLVVTSTWNYYVDPFEPGRHYIAYTDIGFARSMDAGKTWNWWGVDRWTPWRNTCYELAFDPRVKGRVWGAFSNVHDIPNANIIMGRHRSSGPGGICLSTDFGGTWKESNSGLPIAPALSVVLDPRSVPGKRILYASVWDHGVFKSADDGKTWRKKSKGLGHVENMRVCRLILHPDGTLYVLVTGKRQGDRFIPEGAGLYVSKDGGENWKAITKPGQFFWPVDFSADPSDSRVVYLGAADARRQAEQGGLYRTLDGGKTWKLLARKGSRHFGAYFHPRKKEWLYMTLCESGPAKWKEPYEASLWLSRDRGSTWKPFESLPFRNIQRVHFDPKDSTRMYVTTFGGSVWHGPAEPQSGPGAIP